MATPPNFTAGAVLTAAQMNAVGLWLLGTYTSTAGSGTISCPNSLPTDYDTYRIIIYGGSTSTTCNILFQFDNLTASGYYSAANATSFATAAVLTANASNTASWDRVAQGTTTVTAGVADIYATNDNKWFVANTAVGSTTGSAGVSGGYQTSTTAVTGFNLLTSTGTFNANVTVKVYGYRK
jgi:hypothetical protein